MGSNMAEAHPVGFRWPMKAKEKGAKLVHVDPRFTRMSALCDLYVGIRAGSDIAFLGGLINYVLTHERWFKEYVLAYTNASTLIEEGYEDAEGNGGVFSGYDKEGRSYDAAKGHWGYEGSQSDSLLSRVADMLKADGSMGGQTAARRDATTPPLRHANPAAPLRPLHAGAGRRRLRLHAGTAGAGGRHALQQFRAGAHQCHRLRRRLDAAHDRRADDPRRRHPATAAGQHRPARRRRHGHARPFQHPGFDRHSHPVRPAAGLPAAADGRAASRTFGLVHQVRRADHGLLGQLLQVHRQSAQGVVRRGGHEGERVLLSLAAAPRRRLLAAAVLQQDVARRGQGLFSVRPEPRRRRPQRRPAPRRPAQPRLAGGRGLVPDRERRLLEKRPQRAESFRDQNGGLFHPRRLHAGKGRQPDQHATADPVARQGRRSARRLPFRRLVRLQPRQAAEKAL